MDALPDDIDALRATLLEARGRAAVAEADAARARAERSGDQALIATLKLQIEKLQRDLYGRRSERTSRLLDQLEFQLEEAEASASEDELAAERAAGMMGRGATPARKAPSRKPFPAHLPRERVLIPAPTVCPCCGSSRLCKLGESVTERAERIPARWKIIQAVREKVSCRDCETISQPPAPFHTTPRDWAGPNLLATLLFEKFGQHQPLNRQCERLAREGMEISPSTAADQVGAACGVLKPLLDRLAAHVLAAERLHGDDTTVPVLARGKTDTGRIWVYVRDDRPFGGAAAAALFHYSRDRGGGHPEAHLAGWTGVLQVDAYAGYNRLYEAGRAPEPVADALCWAHARRKFFELADIAANKRRGKTAPPISPLALEAVRRIDPLFDIEREALGRWAADHLALRVQFSKPLVDELEGWMRTARAGMSKHAPVAKAMDYLLPRWEGFTRFLRDGRVCLTNNSAEQLEPEDGCLTVFGPGEQWFYALTDDGIENLKDLIHTLRTRT